MKIIFILSMVGIYSLGYSQHEIIKANPLNFHPTFARGINPLSLNLQKHNIAPFENRVSYPAFFCRMELKAVDHLHVWVKFHAGEYDRYALMQNEH